MNRNNMALAGVCAIAAAALISLAVEQASDSRYAHGTMTDIDTVAEAIDVFKEEGFNPEVALKSGAKEVPPIFLAALPDDLKATRNADRRKAVFVTVVLAHVLWANDRLREDRARIERLHRANISEKSMRTRDRKWLARMTKRYGTKPMAFDELLERVDVVPPRLAIAQAVQESGWGTSRFARAGNALFGQHAPVGDGAMTAKGDTAVGMKAFDTIQRSVQSYMVNLNRHRAYERFRSMRAQMRKKGGRMDAIALAGTLGRYSEEGALYIERLRLVMRLPEVAAAKGAKLAEED